MTPRIGSLFSGYGGLDLAVQRVYGGEVVWYSEIDKHACTVLAARHPGVPNLGDITAVDWAAVPPIDILTGGYPCQPFSHAGQRKGTNDERHLWPYVRDAIVALRPMVTVLENVDGHRSLGLDVVLGDLADLGLSARWGVVRAADAGAPHGRKRVFIVVTDANGTGLQGRFLQSTGSGWPQPRRVTAGDWHDLLADSHICGRSEDVKQPGDLSEAAGQGKSGLTDGRCTDGLAADAPVVNPSRAPREQRRRDEGSRQGQLGGSDFGATADADGAGCQARGDARRDGERVRIEPMGSTNVDWGKYAPAIRRWESVLGRPAPAPTVPGANGRPRLSPYLVEWMMGLEPGHVTGHGLKPAACLKMLGNGVVPQQAELALRMLAAADA